MNKKELNLIWIDLNIDSDEYKQYLEFITSLNLFNISTFQNIENAFEKIKKIEFIATFIIIQSFLYKEFINTFQSYENEMKIIPKIIIFKDKNDFNPNKDIEIVYKNPFYNIIEVNDNINDIMEYFYSSYKEINIENEEFEIEYIDNIKKLSFPIYFKTLIKIEDSDDIHILTNFLSKRYINNSQLLYLLKQINSFQNIPIKLLSKYLIRIYTLESYLNREMNYDLLEGKINNFLTYIKIIFEGIKLNSLSCPTNENLYYGTLLSKEKINLLEENLKKKINDLPSSIIFSKSFITFTKNKEYALNYISNFKEKNKEIPVLFNLEKYENVLNDDYFTHCDIEKLSINQDLKEVLFLPFSTFEIENIKSIDFNGKKIKQINLNYIAKYESSLRKELNSIQEDDIICSSNFKNKFNLIEKDEISSITYKSLFQKVLNYKNEIKCVYDIQEKNVGKSVQILNCYEEVKKKFLLLKMIIMKMK